jgi:AcrR family transcriptional regulator
MRHPAPVAWASAGRRARHRAATRERILRAALDLFARQGFFATTVEQITEAADVGKGTFFNYFRTKEHVLAGFGELQLTKVRAAMGRAPSGPVRLVLRDLLHELAKEPGRSPALVRSLLVANLSSEPLRQLMRRNLARGRRMMARMIRAGQASGEIRRGLPAAELAWKFQQLYFGTLLLWALHPPSNLAARLEQAFALFWSGVGAVPLPKGEEGAR